MSQDLVSFVLRFVREAGEDQQVRWRGIIKHVQSNTEESFGQFTDALTFMQEHVNDVINTGFQESREFTSETGRVNPMEESAKLWGKFMTPYAKMMTDSMSDAMAAASGMPASEKVEETASSTMAFWGLPTKSDQTRTVEAIEKLTNQVSILASKVADLEVQLRNAAADETTEEE